MSDDAQKWMNAYQVADAECSELRRKLEIAEKALCDLESFIADPVQLKMIRDALDAIQKKGGA